MVVGGDPMTSNRKSEIIDLSDYDLTCPSITDYPIDYGSFGTFIDNSSLVCGGQNGLQFARDCYSYNMQVLKMNSIM